MKLGAFSVSLAVKDIKASRAFYETLGFEHVHGEEAQNWLILRNGDTVIGLFQGMFEKNILTFNPGWTQQTETLEEFEDVRAIKERLRAAGLEILQEGGDPESGPGSFVVVDPDGNPVLVDQHV
ncbi:MAG: VOC family protein [Rhodothermales bacterium]|nr:VOC family protein [Rhodothermales bacterium]MBO6779713.1 VOC family protein [Rhodothermales bacterium]